MAYFAGDISVVTCPAPRIVKAYATSVTTVEVQFAQKIDSASLSGSQFTIPALRVSNAALSSDGHKVILTTQQPDDADRLRCHGRRLAFAT